MSQQKPKHLPPDSLSDEDVARLHDVRNNVWKGGAQGLVAGGLLGYVGAKLASQAKSHPTLPRLGQPRYTMLAVMATGALGSFLGSVVSGKRSVVHIGDIFSRGATEQELTEYQRRAAEAGGGMRARQADMDAAMRESHGRRMKALEERRRTGDAAPISADPRRHLHGGGGD